MTGKVALATRKLEAAAVRLAKVMAMAGEKSSRYKATRKPKKKTGKKKKSK